MVSEKRPKQKTKIKATKILVPAGNLEEALDSLLVEARSRLFALLKEEDLNSVILFYTKRDGTMMSLSVEGEVVIMMQRIAHMCIDMVEAEAEVEPAITPEERH